MAKAHAASFHQASLAPSAAGRAGSPDEDAVGMEKARARRAFECGRELLRGPRYGKFFCMKSFLFFSSWWLRRAGMRFSLPG